MVTKKSFKVWLYDLAANCQCLNWFFLFLIAVVIIVGLIMAPKPPLHILLSAVGLGIFIAWILVWGWYSVWFRYLAYGVARVISGIWSFLSSTVVQLVIILGLSAWFWVWRKSIFPKKVKRIPIDINFWEEVLKLDSLLKILVIAAALFAMWKLFQSRKRIVICDFENFTDKKELDPVVKGLASICSNEMSRLSKLLKTYDDIHPGATKDMAKVELNLDVGEIGNDFEQIIGPDSSLKIANITVPIRALYGFFRKILHGPMLTGGVHMRGDKFTLTASLKGGKFKGNWQIGFEEDDTPPKDDSEKLDKLAQRLVCRILTDLSQGITPRWKAMQQFIEGLRLFRETQRTEEKRKLYLIKAKDAFSMAVRDDEKFVQCYNNFGYIYRKLKSDEAAEAAFREALKKKPDYHQCYYQLAEIYCENYYIGEINKGWKGDKLQKEYSLSDAQWFCQQAITICPSEPSYWDLLAVIQYYKGGNYAAEEVINSSMTGTMLAWRALCKSIIKGEKTSKYKDTVLICIRNLAVLTGKNNQPRSRCLFRQAIFLDPDNNDLHFERGKSFYRPCKSDENSGIPESNNPPSQTDNKNKVEIDKKNAKKAYNAFKRVFEDDVDVDDPFSFWAFYMNVNAKLYKQEEDKKKKIKYKDVVDEGYIHFLDAAAEIIHKDKSCQYGMIQQNEGLVSEALELANENNETDQRIFLLEFIKFIKRKFVNENIVQRRVGTNAMLSKYRILSEADFFTWVKTQIDIKSAILILDENDEDYFMMAASRLKSAIDKLKDKYPNELKILGLHMYLAKAYLLLGSYEEALKHAREAARLSPYEPAVRAVLGRVYFEMKDYSKAIHELQICFNIGEPTLDILAKIGKAYFKEGNILRDPDKRKDSFQKAAKFFKECHDIIEDKSYEKKDDRYIETLEKTHFNLAYFYWELLNYDDAISYYQTTLEMTIARKRTEYILKTLLSLGWVYIEIQSFAEAEKIFKEAECYLDASPLTKVEITIGLMFSKVERAISFDKNVPFEDTVNDRTVITEDSLKEKAKKDRLEIDRLPLNKAQKKEKIQYLENKKACILALYHECLGRYYFKQEKMDDAEKEFETSIRFMPNPRVYLYLAEFYLREVSECRIGREKILLAKTRNACKLCRKLDLRLQYKQDVDDLEKKLEAREK